MLFLFYISIGKLKEATNGYYYVRTLISCLTETLMAVFILYWTIQPIIWLFPYIVGDKFISLLMRKELGKWLMDVAKYMVTALLLSSVFGDLESPLILISIIVASGSTLGAGLWLVRNKKEKEE